MAFQAIVNGANGLTLYSLHDHFRGRCCKSVPNGGPTGLCQPPTVAEVLQRLETLETLVREVKNMSAVILSCGIFIFFTLTSPFWPIAKAVP